MDQHQQQIIQQLQAQNQQLQHENQDIQLQQQLQQYQRQENAPPVEQEDEPPSRPSSSATCDQR
jgi:hypothetical protein